MSVDTNSTLAQQPIPNLLTQQTTNKNWRNNVRKAIWLYFWLLIFEGALRKWVLPELASPLLIIRDPIAIYILTQAWLSKRFPLNSYTTVIFLVGIVGIVTAILLGHGNLAVALFGGRILLLYFPLMFAIGDYFSREDVLRMGKIILWLTLPMAVLIAVQFYSPQSAWVNRGLGGDTAGAGFSGAMGYFRPPATFSFITGTGQFFSLSACYIFYFWLNPKLVNRLLLISATVGLLASIPLSISRGLFYQVIICALFTGMAVSRKPKLLGRFLIGAALVSSGTFLLSQTALLGTSIEAFTQRFETATEIEGGIEGTLIDRFMGGMFSAISDSDDLPFWGRGVGMGTNMGAQLLVGDRTNFLISEGEWGRIIGEMGILLGLLFIATRLVFISNLALSSYKTLRSGDTLPWQLLSFGLIIILQGQWGQPTTLGFSTLIGGLILASFSQKQRQIVNRSTTQGVKPNQIIPH